MFTKSCNKPTLNLLENASIQANEYEMNSNKNTIVSQAHTSSQTFYQQQLKLQNTSSKFNATIPASQDSSYRKKPSTAGHNTRPNYQTMTVNRVNSTNFASHNCIVKRPMTAYIKERFKLSARVSLDRNSIKSDGDT